MSLPHAVILAGGRGERLGGVNKAELRIGGRRLLDRVLEALGPVAQPVMISTGAHGARSTLPPDTIGVPDLAADMGGPLAGLAAAVDMLQRRNMAQGLLISVAVDTPFLPPGFAADMVARMGSSPAGYATWRDAFYPPNAVWRVAALAALPEQVREGCAPDSLKALHFALGARAIDWQAGHEENPFANLNTLADLTTLGRIARKRGVSPLIHTPGN